MRRSLTGLLAIGALALSPQLGLAQDFVGRDLGPIETLDFYSGSNVAAAWGDVQVGPYSADIITSGNPTIPGITLYCVDFENSIGGGTIWDAYITSIGPTASDDATTGTLGNTRLGNGSGNLEAYRQTAFLASLFASWSSYTSWTYDAGSGPVAFGTKASVWSGIHAAMWSITSSTFPAGFDGWPWYVTEALAAGMAAPFVTLAATTDLSTFDFSEWSVVTDVADPGTQEFLIRTSVVPEPETYVLMFSGLLLIGFVARKRFMESSEQA